MSTPPDPSRCPICGNSNACAVERARECSEPPTECWCMTADFSCARMATIPDASRGLACICARCAAGQMHKKKPLP